MVGTRIVPPRRMDGDLAIFTTPPTLVNGVDATTMITWRRISAELRRRARYDDTSSTPRPQHRRKPRSGSGVRGHPAGALCPSYSDVGCALPYSAAGILPCPERHAGAYGAGVAHVVQLRRTGGASARAVAAVRRGILGDLEAEPRRQTALRTVSGTGVSATVPSLGGLPGPPNRSTRAAWSALAWRSTSSGSTWCAAALVFGEHRGVGGVGGEVRRLLRIGGRDRTARAQNRRSGGA